MKNDHNPILDDYRHDWYNKDYLELVAKRINLYRCKNILDVGCGNFHWSSDLLEFGANDFSLTGIDIASIDSNKLKSISEKFKSDDVSFINGNSEALPFKDSSFDLVTCQTLLIHLKEPAKTLKEMYRVLKQKGKILVSEPNNLSQTLFTNSLNINDNFDERIEKIKAKLKSERNKIETGNGNNSIGETVPVLLDECGFVNIRCWANDKINKLKPPYETIEEQNKIKMLRNLIGNCPFPLSEKEKEEVRSVIEMIDNKNFVAYNPTMLFLSYGEK